MTLTIPLPPETEIKLRERAAASGQDVATYALQAIEEKLRTTPAPGVNEVLAPLRQEFHQSGMSDDELSDLVKQARNEVRQERRAP